jgi:phage shock protein A
MRKIAIGFAAATLALAACDKSKDELNQKVAELSAVNAQKDSLIQEVMATSQFIGDLTADLAAVKALNAGKPVASEAKELEGKTPAQMRATVRERVKELADRLQQSETRLSQSRARVASLTSNNADMQKQMAVYDSTISSLRVVLESQKTEIAALTSQVSGLQQANVMLAATRDTLTTQRDDLTHTVANMTNEANKVYYVIGKEDDLVKKGILNKKGGFLGMGKTLTPARSLKESDFTQLDRMRDSTISFPDANAKYTIVSRQPTQYLAVEPDKNNEIREGLKISSPEGFWATSKFLIVVQK